METNKKETPTTRSNRTMQYMTGLYNANGYLLAAEKLDRSGKLKDYTAFFFNINDFGAINNQYGYKEGDEIIKRYAKKLKNFAQDDEYIGHMGEDNFTALIKKARRDLFVYYISRVDVTGKKNTEKVFLSATAGIWDIDEKVDEIRDVISRPSTALVHAKYIVHQNTAMATTDMVSRAEQKRVIMKNFHEALENEEFMVYYQPKVDSKKKRLVGAEGLVRWMHDGKMVSPGAFIPLLEQNGKILLLDYYVLQKACEDIRRWGDAGFDTVPVSVNVSRKDLSDKQLAVNINNIIQESGIDKDLIEIEVTETVDDEEHGILTDFINQLYSMKIKTAIDDFGSGYSSLSTLREFQVHTLKIDRSFINTDEFSWKDEIILADIIRMAKRLGIEVLTEGVEREDQLYFVNKAGCDVIQGFYYDRPLPREEFMERLKDKKFYKGRRS